jgi:N-acetyl-anhydromuramyl-L-alanine amidase AmpD
LGNLNVQPLPDAQLQSLINTIAYACKKFNIPYETIASHRDYSKQTTCPGENLYKHIQNGYIKEEVRKKLGSK